MKIIQKVAKFPLKLYYFIVKENLSIMNGRKKMATTKETVKKITKETVKAEAPAKVEAPKTETKADAKAPAKKVATKTTATKTAAKKAPAKKAATKTTATKTAAKKAPAKKAAAKATSTVIAQFGGLDIDITNVVDEAKAAYVAKGNKAADAKDVKVYVTSGGAYAVVNGEEIGKIK